MSPEAKVFFNWVVRKLPELLESCGDPFEALERLGSLWREHRTHNIQDRDEAVKENRKRIDRRLWERLLGRKRKN